MATWEELVAVWQERVRELRRQICLHLGTDQPDYQDIKRVFWSPGPDGAPFGRFPNEVFDLDDPTAFYKAVIMQRQERELKDYLNTVVHARLAADALPPRRWL